jgi:hypothetical protein
MDVRGSERRGLNVYLRTSKVGAPATVLRVTWQTFVGVTEENKETAPDFATVACFRRFPGLTGPSAEDLRNRLV